MVSAGVQRSSVAHVQGHSGSGATSVAVEAADKLLGNGFWAQSVYVGIKASRFSRRTEELTPCIERSWHIVSAVSHRSAMSMQGARSADAAAARLASALGILSFPVITNELLRLTTYLHARSKQQGRLGTFCR